MGVVCLLLPLLLLELLPLLLRWLRLRLWLRPLASHTMVGETLHARLPAVALLLLRLLLGCCCCCCCCCSCLRQQLPMLLPRLAVA